MLIRRKVCKLLTYTCHENEETNLTLQAKPSDHSSNHFTKLCIGLFSLELFSSLRKEPLKGQANETLDSRFSCISFPSASMLFIGDNLCCSSVTTYVVHRWQLMLFISDNFCSSSVTTYVVHRWQHILFIGDNLCCSPVTIYIVHRWQLL